MERLVLVVGLSRRFGLKIYIVHGQGEASVCKLMTKENCAGTSCGRAKGMSDSQHIIGPLKRYCDANHHPASIPQFTNHQTNHCGIHKFKSMFHWGLGVTPP